MISTIFIDTEKERLFPMAGNTREAVAEFVKNQIDLSFVALCSAETIQRLHPSLTEAQASAVLSTLLAIPSIRRESLGPFEICVNEIFNYVKTHSYFIITGWAAIFKQNKLPLEYNHKTVVHAFGDAIEREFHNACAMVLQLGTDEAMHVLRAVNVGHVNSGS